MQGGWLRKWILQMTEKHSGLCSSHCREPEPQIYVAICDHFRILSILKLCLITIMLKEEYLHQQKLVLSGSWYRETCILPSLWTLVSAPQYSNEDTLILWRFLIRQNFYDLRLLSAKCMVANRRTVQLLPGICISHITRCRMWDHNNFPRDLPRFIVDFVEIDSFFV